MNTLKGADFLESEENNFVSTLLYQFEDEIKTFIKIAVYHNYHDFINEKVHDEKVFCLGINWAIDTCLSSLKKEFIKGYKLSDDFIRMVEEFSCFSDEEMKKAYMSNPYYSKNSLRRLRIARVYLTIDYSYHKKLLRSLVQNKSFDKKIMKNSVEDFSKGICLASDMLGIFIFEVFCNINNDLDNNFNELAFFKIINNINCSSFYDNSYFPLNDECKQYLSDIYSKIDFLAIFGLNDLFLKKSKLGLVSFSCQI